MKNLTWQNPEQLFVAQELINKVKSKCCGIKDKDKIILFFKNAEDGFNRDNGIIGFEIAGKDMRFHKANATIDANKKTVIISAPGVKAPIAARYGFRNFQIGNLQNVQGLPVLPFRTDK